MRCMSVTLSVLTATVHSPCEKFHFDVSVLLLSKLYNLKVLPGNASKGTQVARQTLCVSVFVHSHIPDHISWTSYFGYLNGNVLDISFVHNKLVTILGHFCCLRLSFKGEMS